MNKIEKFNPTKNEIKEAVKNVSGLTIKGIEDEKGYEVVKTAKKTLAGYRISIAKFGLKQRREAIDWQKEVRRQEEELLALIEPTETELKNELLKVDEAKKMEERKILLPTRRKMANDIDWDIADKELLSMDEKLFSENYNATKMFYDEEQKAKKEAEEAEKQRKIELEEAKKQAKIEAREEAEKDKKEAILNEKRKAREAKKKIIDDQNQREQERKDAEEEQARKLEEKKQADKAKQEKLERNKTFQEFLEKNGYDKNTDILQRKNGEVGLYRIVNTLKL